MDDKIYIHLGNITGVTVGLTIVQSKSGIGMPTHS